METITNTKKIIEQNKKEGSHIRVKDMPIPSFLLPYVKEHN